MVQVCIPIRRKKPNGCHTQSVLQIKDVFVPPSLYPTPRILHCSVTAKRRWTKESGVGGWSGCHPSHGSDPTEASSCAFPHLCCTLTSGQSEGKWLVLITRPRGRPSLVLNPGGPISQEICYHRPRKARAAIKQTIHPSCVKRATCQIKHKTQALPTQEFPTIPSGQSQMCTSHTKIREMLTRKPCPRWCTS